MINHNDNIATIRTMVPAYVGLFLAWVARRTGFVVDEETSFAMMSVAAGFVTFIYYRVLKWAENRWPNLGWFLGVAKMPVYPASIEAEGRAHVAKLRNLDAALNLTDAECDGLTDLTITSYPT